MEPSPALRNDQPFFVKVWSTEKATMEVFSPLELVRSVTDSLTDTSRPPARNSSATASTSARTSVYFSSPTKVLADFFVYTLEVNR